MSRILKLIPYVAPEVRYMPAHAEWGDRAQYAARVELPAVIGIIKVAMRGKVVAGDHCTFLHPTCHDITKHCGFHMLTVEPAAWSHFMLLKPYGQMDLELDGESASLMRVGCALYVPYALSMRDISGRGEEASPPRVAAESAHIERHCVHQFEQFGYTVASLLRKELNHLLKDFKYVRRNAGHCF
jgi:hypothetical protein